MKLLVVVLCYKVPDLTDDCLRSLEPEIARVRGARVGGCENGTGIEAVEKIRRAIDGNGWNSWAELTAVEVNRGFCGGNNLVILYGRGNGNFVRGNARRNSFPAGPEPSGNISVGRIARRALPDVAVPNARGRVSVLVNHTRLPHFGRLRGR